MSEFITIAAWRHKARVYDVFVNSEHRGQVAAVNEAGAIEQAGDMLSMAPAFVKVQMRGALYPQKLPSEQCEDLLLAVCRLVGVEASRVRADDRHRAVAAARRAFVSGAMVLPCKPSLQQIGRTLRKPHSSIIYIRGCIKTLDVAVAAEALKELGLETA